MRCHGRDGGQDHRSRPQRRGLCFDRHADSLGSGVAITDLGNVPPHSFRVPVVDDGKQPDLAIQHGRDLRCVGAPHQVWRRGDNAAVVGFALSCQVAVWRGGALRHPDRSAPRLGYRCARGPGHHCKIKS